MKISNVKVDLLNWPTDPWQVGSGMFFGGKKQLGIVTVETDEGVSGHAFLSRPEHQASSLIEFLKPKVMGRNPQDIGAIWWDLWKMNRAVSTYAIGAIDVCLWDINGKIAGQPIHRLLGTCKESVPVYSSSAFHETTEEYAEEAIRFQGMGWTAHKIHPHGDAKSDIAISPAIPAPIATRVFATTSGETPRAATISSESSSDFSMIEQRPAETDSHRTSTMASSVVRTSTLATICSLSFASLSRIDRASGMALGVSPGWSGALRRPTPAVRNPPGTRVFPSRRRSDVSDVSARTAPGERASRSGVWPHRVRSAQSCGPDGMFARRSNAGRARTRGGRGGGPSRIRTWDRPVMSRLL